MGSAPCRWQILESTRQFLRLRRPLVVSVQRRGRHGAWLQNRTVLLCQVFINALIHPSIHFTNIFALPTECSPRG